MMLVVPKLYELLSKLLKGGHIGDVTGEHYRVAAEGIIIMTQEFQRSWLPCSGSTE